MSKILLVDDDMDLTEMLEDKLVSENHTVERVNHGLEARDRIRLYEYDVIVLDWNLPGKSGVEICREMRANGNRTPVLMLTGKATIDDKETGLDAGADDYLTKPFDAREFSARMRALLRRQTSAAPSNILKVRQLTMDLTQRKVMLGEQEIELSPLEFSVLEFLMRYPNEVFSTEALLNRVWSSEADSSPEAVRVCMARLRKRIDQPGEQSMIDTLRGVGYRLLG